MSATSKKTLIGLGLAVGLVVLLLLAVLLPSYGPARVTESKNACINYLRQIDGAKEQWALERRADKVAEVSMMDLIGTNNYLSRFPKCRTVERTRWARLGRSRNVV